VDYFDIISESYLHLCYDSEKNVQSNASLDALGASAGSFIEMLHQSGVYSKTNTKLKRVYLLISQSKQAWEWKGSSSSLSSVLPPKSKPTIDEVVVQYERISFAEYVELLGRLALQLAHEKDILVKKKQAKQQRAKQGRSMHTRSSGGMKKEGEAVGGGGGKSAAQGVPPPKTPLPTKKATIRSRHPHPLHDSLDMDRIMFLDELPLLLHQIQEYIRRVDDKVINEKGSNLKRILQRSNAAARARRRNSIVTVMKQVREVKKKRLKLKLAHHK